MMPVFYLYGSPGFCYSFRRETDPSFILAARNGDNTEVATAKDFGVRTAGLIVQHGHNLVTLNVDAKNS